MDGRLRHSAGFLAGGGDTPSPTPFPAEGVAQLFIDEDCTTLADGPVNAGSTVYLRFNDAVEEGTVLWSKQGPGETKINITEAGVDLASIWVNHEAVPPISAGTIVPLEGAYAYMVQWNVNRSIYIMGE